MARLIVKGFLLCAVVLAGCQNAKMTGVQPKPESKNTAQSNPPQYNPPPAHNPPPAPNPAPTYNPPPQPEVHPHYEEPPVVDVHEVSPAPVEPVCKSNCGPQVVAPRPHPRPKTCQDTGTCQPVKGECETIPLNAKLESPKLDVLFVVDTSASLRGGSYKKTGGELGQLARDMRFFMKRLDARADVRIGMILGHGPAKKATHGRLFSTGGSDPAMIDYKQIQTQMKAANKSASAEQVEVLAQDRVGKLLEHKMTHMPIEHKGAEGEALLLSLYDALSRPDLRGQIQAAGLLRKDAQLAVITISDEQDVCFDYAAHGVKPRKEDPIETKFFNEVCSKAVNGGPLQPGHVYQALQAVAGDKLIVAGIHYKDNNIPQGREDENEMGYGYLDLIKLAGGQLADLAQVNDQSPTFWAQLDLLGKFTDFKMHFTNTFSCRSNVHPASVIGSSVVVDIVNKDGQPLAQFGKGGANGPAKWQVVVDDHGHPYGRAVVSSQTLGDLLKSQKITEGFVKITFSAQPEAKR